MMEKMMDWYRLLPRFWLQNEPTDKHWDAALNAALDAHGVGEVGEFSCRVGPFWVWIQNWPYSYGKQQFQWGCGYCLPCVGTRLRLKAAIGAKLVETATGIEAAKPANRCAFRPKAKARPPKGGSPNA